jgi:2-haloacid dehalogenase
MLKLKISGGVHARVGGEACWPMGLKSRTPPRVACRSRHSKCVCLTLCYGGMIRRASPRGQGCSRAIWYQMDFLPLPFQCQQTDIAFVATFFHVQLSGDILLIETNAWQASRRTGCRGDLAWKALSSRTMVQIRAVVFDVHGTLLNVHAAMARHSERLGAGWLQMSADWRQKQLEYSWVRSLAGPAHHRDFWQLTRDSLDWAVASHGVSDAAVLAGVLQAYRTLDPYPEVPDVPRRIPDRGLRTALLSNGEPGMLADATRSAGLDQFLDCIMSVEAAGTFKPSPLVYRLAADCLGLDSGDMVFVSSNPWDVFGAHAFGFQVFWINRTGQPDEYDLRNVATELTDLAVLPAALDERGRE